MHVKHGPSQMNWNAVRYGVRAATGPHDDTHTQNDKYLDKFTNFLLLTHGFMSYKRQKAKISK